MSKITFRADDDLVQRLEAFDASKSEVMREALRQYLDEARSPAPAFPAAGDGEGPESLEELVADRVDSVLRERLDALGVEDDARDVNVNIALDGDGAEASEAVDRKTPAVDDGPDGSGPRPCSQCGETVSPDHVYCPNCGEKAARRAFCDCGDELRSDWSFCPGCGRRTPAADVLDKS